MELTTVNEKKTYNARRRDFSLHTGGVDDVVEKLAEKGEFEILQGVVRYAQLDCPFVEDFGCQYSILEEFSDKEDIDIMRIAVAAHMLVSHLEEDLDE